MHFLVLSKQFIHHKNLSWRPACVRASSEEKKAARRRESQKCGLTLTFYTYHVKCVGQVPIIFSGSMTSRTEYECRVHRLVSENVHETGRSHPSMQARPLSGDWVTNRVCSRYPVYTIWEWSELQG
jgi:hypothetical protein